MGPALDDREAGRTLHYPALAPETGDNRGNDRGRGAASFGARPRAARGRGGPRRTLLAGRRLEERMPRHRRRRIRGRLALGRARGATAAGPPGSGAHATRERAVRRAGPAAGFLRGRLSDPHDLARVARGAEPPPARADPDDSLPAERRDRGRRSARRGRDGALPLRAGSAARRKALHALPGDDDRPADRRARSPPAAAAHARDLPPRLRAEGRYLRPELRYRGGCRRAAGRGRRLGDLLGGLKGENEGRDPIKGTVTFGGEATCARRAFRQM